MNYAWNHMIDNCPEDITACINCDGDLDTHDLDHCWHCQNDTENDDE